jgi:Family of unknown function (DUF6113)
VSTTPDRQRTEQGPGQRVRRQAPSPLAGVTYVVLFVLGLMEGLIGSFQYSRGPAPLASILFCIGIFATCLLAGWATRSFGGAVAPAVGWIVASFVLSMPDSTGSVIITNTTAGKWYLYGGAFSAAVGAAMAFVWVRSQSRPR